jgi:uncharacterized protein YutE (UPF0331/DUF86 family)
MLDRDVVLAKIAVIDRCLSRIEEVRGGRRPELRPVDADDIIAVNLMRAVQAAIDLATHVVGAEAYGTPGNSREAFALLERQGILSSELSSHLQKMVGFRNIAIHEYQKIDPEIVERIIEHHLGELRAFGAKILDAFQIPNSGS